MGRHNSLLRNSFLPTSRLFALLMLFSILSLSLYISFVPHAHAEENVPDVPGSISGVVTNAAGEPLVGIEIRLWYRDLYNSGGLSSYSLTAATTQSDGSYRISLLGPNTYLVQFLDPGQQYASEFYNNVHHIDEATEIPIAGNVVTGIDGVLAFGGTITGALRPTSALSSTNASMSLYAPDPLNPTEWQQIRSTTLDMTATTYSFAGWNPC